MNTEKKVVTRSAPSPTGNLHVGTALIGLVNFIFARQHGGKYVLRIEDTDAVRCTPEFEQNIFDGFNWLGLEYSDLAKQSERTEMYAEKITALIESGKAYISKEKAKDDSGRDVEVVRLRNPGKVVTFTDEVHGDVTFDTTELGDFVIARSVTDVLYHFAVVVDDADMGVTHVIRGDDHISNTPRQILIQEALGIERPVYAHLPLLLAKDRSKLSKRKGAVAVSDYRDQGYLPEAVINYLALLCWNPGTEKELYTMEELVQDFSLSQVHKSGAIFDIEKLKWLQKEHKKLLPKEVVVADLKTQLAGNTGILEALERSEAALNDMIERYSLKSDIEEALKVGEFDFYEKRPEIQKEMLAWKKDPNPEAIKERLQKIIELLGTIDEDAFLYEAIKESIWSYAETEGKGGVLWPMRVALSGKERSPDPFVLAEALGKEETCARLESALTLFT